MNRINEIKERLNKYGPGTIREYRDKTDLILQLQGINSEQQSDVKYLLGLNERLTRIVLHKTGEDKLTLLPADDIKFIAQLRIGQNTLHNCPNIDDNYGPQVVPLGSRCPFCGEAASAESYIKQAGE